MKTDAVMLQNLAMWKDRSQPRRMEDVLISLVRTDPVLQSIIANYAESDLRGRTTLARIAQAQPKSNKEFK